MAVHPVKQEEPQGQSPVLYALAPMLRAFTWGAIGFSLGSILVALIEGSTLFSERPVAVGYVLGLIGWMLGGGAWEAWVKPWFGLPSAYDQGSGVARYLRLSTDHKVIGLQYLVSAALAFFLAGLMAMLMRVELGSAGLSLFSSAQSYNAVMAVHGTLMIFAVAVVAIVGGFGNYFVPIMVGADDMPFPYVNGISWWLVVPGILAVALSPLLGGSEAGWTGYAPLSVESPAGALLYFLGVFTLGLSSLFTAINVIGTVLYKRAPGLTLSRLPMFVWGMLATSFLNLIWVPVVGTLFIMGLSDRLVPTNFFRPTGGGLPLVWQDIFWIFGHPEVYIIILTAWALWLEIIPVFSRKSLFGYNWAVAGFLGVTFLSSLVWTHHMFTTGLDDRLVPFMTTTELISIPSGFLFMVALGTLWRGRIRLKTPMLLILMSLFNFLIGGVTGVFLNDVPSDYMLQDTYFVVAHFHYTILGGMVFAWLAGLYYWFPKFAGRMFDETLGKVGAWWVFVAFNLTFFPMFALGPLGMNRRVAEYPPYLEGLNLWITVWAILLGLAFLVHLVNLAYSWIWGPRAPANPWGGKTLEWQTSSPPPHHNFEEPVRVSEGFYTYGQTDTGRAATEERTP